MLRQGPEGQSFVLICETYFVRNVLSQNDKDSMLVTN